MNTHLDLGHYDASVLTGRGEGSERSWQYYGTWACETAEVTAGDVVHFMAHDDGVHDKETWPRQPQCVLLHDERRPLEAQCYGHAPTGKQVKTETEPKDYCALEKLSLGRTSESLDSFCHSSGTKRQCSLTMSQQSFLSLLHVVISNGFLFCGLWHTSFQYKPLSKRNIFNTMLEQ